MPITRLSAASPGLFIHDGPVSDRPLYRALEHASTTSGADQGIGENISHASGQTRSSYRFLCKRHWDSGSGDSAATLY